MSLRSWFRKHLREWADRQRRIDELSTSADPRDPTRWDTGSVRVKQSNPNGSFSDRIVR